MSNWDENFLRLEPVVFPVLNKEFFNSKIVDKPKKRYHSCYSQHQLALMTDRQKFNGSPYSPGTGKSVQPGCKPPSLQPHPGCSTRSKIIKSSCQKKEDGGGQLALNKKIEMDAYELRLRPRRCCLICSSHDVYAEVQRWYCLTKSQPLIRHMCMCTSRPTLSLHYCTWPMR